MCCGNWLQQSVVQRLRWLYLLALNARIYPTTYIRKHTIPIVSGAQELIQSVSTQMDRKSLVVIDIQNRLDQIPWNDQQFATVSFCQIQYIILKHKFFIYAKSVVHLTFCDYSLQRWIVSLRFQHLFVLYLSHF